ncbi:hypothetical protein D3C76_358310 [compost metagenome]
MRLFLVDKGLEQLGHGQGAELVIALDQDGTVRPQGQGCAQLFLGSARADADHDDFTGNALLFQAHGLFHGDFAEGVEGHFHVGQIDAGLVRLDAHLDVEIDHALDCYEDFHWNTPKNPGAKPG